MNATVNQFSADISAHFKQHTAAESEAYVTELYATASVNDRELIEAALQSIGDEIGSGASDAVENSGFTKANIAQCKDAIREFNALSAQNMSVDMLEILKLMQSSSQSMRNAYRKIRNDESSAQISTMLDAAKEMKSAADHRYKAAQIQAWTQIATGTVQGIGAGMSAFGSFKSLGKMDSITKVDSAGKEFSKLVDTTASKNWGNFGSTSSATGESLGNIGGGIGKLISAGEEREAALADARGRELDASGKLHESAYQDANDQMQRNQEIIRDVMDKLQAIQQSNLETNRRINNNI